VYSWRCLNGHVSDTEAPVTPRLEQRFPRSPRVSYWWAILGLNQIASLNRDTPMPMDGRQEHRVRADAVIGEQIRSRLKLGCHAAEPIPTPYIDTRR
jgi:hypothetical protein